MWIQIVFFGLFNTQWEPDVEQGLAKSYLSLEQQNSLVRQLCTTMMAQTGVLRFSERSCRHAAGKPVSIS